MNKLLARDSGRADKSGNPCNPGRTERRNNPIICTLVRGRHVDDLRTEDLQESELLLFGSRAVEIR